MKNKLKISLIIPCYNEELNIQKGTLDKIFHHISERDDIVEVIIVDDGSTDKTVDVIKSEYLNKYPTFKLIENKHYGKAYSIITGIKQAKGDYVIVTDFDLATPIEELSKLIEKAYQNDKIIIGSRTGRSGAPWSRKLQSTGFIFIRDAILNMYGIKDTQCGFKMFEKKSALTIIEKLRVYKQLKLITNSSVSAGFDLEFLFIARKLKYQITEIPIIWRHVETKRVNFLRDSFETIKDICKIKYFDMLKKYD